MYLYLSATSITEDFSLEFYTWRENFKIKKRSDNPKDCDYNKNFTSPFMANLPIHTEKSKLLISSDSHGRGCHQNIEDWIGTTFNIFNASLEQVVAEIDGVTRNIDPNDCVIKSQNIYMYVDPNIRGTNKIENYNSYQLVIKKALKNIKVVHLNNPSSYIFYIFWWQYMSKS